MLARLKVRWRWGSPPWLLSAAVVLPEAVLGLSIPLLPLLLVSPRLMLWSLVAVMSAFVVLSVPRLEALLFCYVFDASEPSRDERERLERLLVHVSGSSPLTRGLQVRVQRSEHFQASAFGGSVLAVTSGAMRLDDEHLSAVLAHEVGHLVLGHSALGVLRIMALAPVRATSRLGGYLTVADPVTFLFGLALLLVVGVLAVPVRVIEWLSLPLRRWEERSADVFAADLGWGVPLAEVLDAVASSEGSDVRSRARRLLSTHPSSALRSSRLRERVRMLDAGEVRSRLA